MRRWLGVLLALVGGSAALAEPPPNPVRMNQLGFRPDSAKRAVVPDASTTPLPWRLLDRAGAVVAQGRTRVFGDDRASGLHVHQVDFSQATRPGSGYRLVVGAAASRAFEISPRVYARLKYDALNFFFQQRSGMAIEARFAGGRPWARPAGHQPDRASCVPATDAGGAPWARCSYTLDATDGWYDAGDQGKYLVNGGIALWTLQNAYERAHARGVDAAFADGRVAIPENHNGVNDLLDEARWELQFMLAMQAPDGTRMRLPVGPPAGRALPPLADVDASGLAHQKIADAHWTPLPTAPHEDRQTRYLYPPTTAATLNLAAVAAQGARLWRAIDPAFSARCLQAARRAFAAAARNPQLYAVGQFDGSGGYGDPKLTDEVYWAAAELFATTGEAQYRAALEASPYRLAGPGPGPREDISWSEVEALGTITLATVPNGLPQAEVAAARAALVRAADRYLDEAGREGFALPYAPAQYPWGSNGAVINRAMVLALAHDLTGQARYRDGAVDAMDYLLGRNPLDQSFVTGYGARPTRNPHHRFWAHALNPAYPTPPPGVLSGGPDSSAFSDPVAITLKGKCRPQTCWRDEAMAWTENEVAINWNAPFFWVAAYLDEPGQRTATHS